MVVTMTERLETNDLLARITKFLEKSTVALTVPSKASVDKTRQELIDTKKAFLSVTKQLEELLDGCDKQRSQLLQWDEEYRQMLALVRAKDPVAIRASDFGLPVYDTIVDSSTINFGATLRELLFKRALWEVNIASNEGDIERCSSELVTLTSRIEKLEGML